MIAADTSVKVAVRVRPLNSDELQVDSSLHLGIAGNTQVIFIFRVQIT